MQKLIEKSSYGTYVAHELDKPIRDNQIIQNKSFILTLQTKKLEYDIFIEQDTQYSHLKRMTMGLDSFNFCIRFKTTIDERSEWFSHVTLANRCGNSILKSSSFVGRKFEVLSAISSENLKKFKRDVGQIYLHIFLVESVLHLSCTHLPTSIANNIPKNEEIALTKTIHYCKCSKSFADLYESKVLADVIIVSKSKEYDVHKTILSARSSYFYALFKNDMKETQNGRVLIKNNNEQLVQDVIVENLIEYIYTGKAKDMNKYTFELYELAHMYNILTLQEECVDYWKSTINIENAVMILIIAKKYDVQELLDVVSNIFKNRTSEIFKSNNFKKLLGIKLIKNM